MAVIVLDASITVNWLLDDEPEARVEARIRNREDSGIVAPLWHYEVRNALLSAQRAGRIAEEERRGKLEDLASLGISTDSETDLDEAYRLALDHSLSFYDALYLELAVRQRLALATLDRDLAAAAQNTGLEVLTG